jgi:hypothetical protein
MKIKMLFAGIITALMVIIPATTASAAVFDRVYVTSGSNGKVVIKDGTWGSQDMWAYDDSYLTYGWYDLDYFWVPGGCDAKNINTGYVYAGNKQYGPLPGNAKLSLKVIC